MLTLVALFAIQGWSDLGGSGSGGGISSTPGVLSNLPRVAVDRDGLPTVSWLERNDNVNNVHLRRWNGAAWTELGGSATGLGISNSPLGAFGASMALDSAGRPVVVWSAPGPDGSLDLHLRRWTGSAWTGVDGSASTLVFDAPDTSLYAVVAIDAADRPVVCWMEVGDSGQVIFLKRWNGAAWIELGGSATTGIGSAGSATNPRPSLALDGAGNPAVAWPSKTVFPTNVYMKRWTGAEWEELAGSGSGNGVSGTPSGTAVGAALAVDSLGRPVLAWKNAAYGGQPQVWLRRWDGATWEELGGSATDGGISQSTGYPGEPSLALDPQDRPAVAWAEPTDTGGQICLRRWSGTAWEGLSGSASGMGINGAAASATAPQVQVGPTGLLAVCWRETLAPGNSDILLRWRSTLAPSLAAPLQYRLDGATPIPPGGVVTVDQAGFVAKSAVTDGDGPACRLQVEVRPVGTPFSGVPTATGDFAATGSTASLLSGGLVVGQSYHWQARAVDDSGTPSPWIAFGSADPDEADFRVRSNDAPGAVAAPLVDEQSGATISAGGQVKGMEGVRFQAIVDDPDGDRVRIEVEIRRGDADFSGLPTAAGDLTVDGGLAGVVLLLPGGDYEWRYRGVDEYGAGSAWTGVAAGGRFSVAPLGSVGVAACGARAKPAASWPALGILGVVVAIRRRR